MLDTFQINIIKINVSFFEYVKKEFDYETYFILTSDNIKLFDKEKIVINHK